MLAGVSGYSGNPADGNKPYETGPLSETSPRTGLAE